MLTKRIIACLDVRGGEVVKGIKFQELRSAGDPGELAASHVAAGADEIVMLDISATSEQRSTLLHTVHQVARRIFVPLTVGGGIRSLPEASAVFDAGADKISINSAALSRPALITEIAQRYGSQAVMVAIDAKRSADRAWFEACTHSGRRPSGKNAVAWATEAQDRGAGEILLTSMDRDGTMDGFDCELVSAVYDQVRIPVIASGGAGNLGDFVQVFQQGRADAALAASIFHFGLQCMRDLKQGLHSAGIPVRWPC